MLEEMDKSGKQFVDIKVRAYKYSVQVIRFIDSTEVRNKFYPLINPTFTFCNFHWGKYY